MTTLVVGCGYVGLRVARRLLDRGDRVLGTTRRAERGAELTAVGIEPILLDVAGNGAIGLPSVDRIVYGVGFDRRSGRARREVVVDGLQRFLDALPTAAPRLVFTGTTSVYGQTDGAWVDENDPTDPIEESGRVALEAERIARAAGAIVLRFAGLYGPSRVIRRDDLQAGRSIQGEPEKLVNLIHVDDAAKAVVAAIDRGVAGRVVNVVDDQPVSRRELYTITSEVLGAPPPRFQAPDVDATVEPNRRIKNARMKRELAVALDYPNVRLGLTAIE